ncbi:MAG: hypothetical protein RMK84_11010 [Oscillochloridaceae bacterium]|nr:hypothetical protein [Chloroflexaceae bacterium]MDW8390643.1 hypothetical protein [Oscillochloridaceae bacterium]
MANPLVPAIRNLFLERPARKRDYAYFAGRLEASGKELEARFAAAADSPENRRQLRHIVGLERWGQRRLRTALGEPPVQDEMDRYAPPGGQSLLDLRAAFAATRRETVVLIRQLETRGVPPDWVIPHNEYGPLTLRAWLHYLDLHARLEGKRIKPARR